MKKWNKIDKNIFKPTNCNSLVSLPTDLNNTWNINITKYLRGLTYLNKFTLGIFIGILLGDASISIQTNGTNPRIRFKQSIINFPFFWTVYINLSHYISKFPPHFEFSTVKGKI